MPSNLDTENQLVKSLTDQFKNKIKTEYVKRIQFLLFGFGFRLLAFARGKTQKPRAYTEGSLFAVNSLATPSSPPGVRRNVALGTRSLITITPPL